MRVYAWQEQCSLIHSVKSGRSSGDRPYRSPLSAVTCPSFVAPGPKAERCWVCCDLSWQKRFFFFLSLGMSFMPSALVRTDSIWHWIKHTDILPAPWQDLNGNIPEMLKLQVRAQSSCHQKETYEVHTWILLFHFQGRYSSSSGHSPPDGPTSPQSCSLHHYRGTTLERAEEQEKQELSPMLQQCSGRRIAWCCLKGRRKNLFSSCMSQGRSGFLLEMGPTPAAFNCWGLLQLQEMAKGS